MLRQGGQLVAVALCLADLLARDHLGFAVDGGLAVVAL